MSKSVKIILMTVIILLIIVAGIASYLVYNSYQEYKLREEIGKLSETNTNTDKTMDGKYGELEVQIKKDFKEFVDRANELSQLYVDYNDIKALSPVTYSSDGPEFTNTKQKVSENDAKRKEVITALTNLSDESKIEERLNAANISGMHRDLYKKIFDELEIKSAVKSIAENEEDFLKHSQGVIKILDYLTANKDKWYIKDNMLTSTDQAFIDEYNNQIKVLETEEEQEQNQENTQTQESTQN